MTSTPKAILTTARFIPRSGHVVVMTAAGVGEDTAGHGVRCSITTGTVVDFDATTLWKSGGIANVGTISAVRGFVVSEGEQFRARWVCEHLGNASTDMYDARMIFLYTPI